MRGAMMTMMMYDLLIFILTWMNVWVKWKLWHVACGDVLGSWCHIEWWHGWIRRCKSGTNGQIEFEFGHQLVVTCTHSSCAGVTHCLVCLRCPPTLPMPASDASQLSPNCVLHPKCLSRKYVQRETLDFRGEGGKCPSPKYTAGDRSKFTTADIPAVNWTPPWEKEF